MVHLTGKRYVLYSPASAIHGNIKSCISNDRKPRKGAIRNTKKEEEEENSSLS